MDELKPCPNPNCSSTDLGRNTDTGGSQVCCRDCETAGPYGADPEGAWNALPRRDDAQDVRAALERLMESAYWATQVHRRAGHDTEHTAADCEEWDHILDCNVARRLDRDIAGAKAALKREA